jgi:hypothetical protein
MVTRFKHGENPIVTMMILWMNRQKVLIPIVVSVGVMPKSYLKRLLEQHGQSLDGGRWTTPFPVFM